MSDAEFDDSTWRDELEAHRAEKDEFLAEHPQSPIPPGERDAFDGLDYFEPDPAYRVEATAEVHDDPEPVEMSVTGGGAPQRYLRVATLRFRLDGEEHALAAYSREGQDGLFVPFRDKTTGQQTYEDGRYMEFEVDGAGGASGGPAASDGDRSDGHRSDAGLSDGDELTLDFNLAYSPFCAYSEAFACPLPPEENWLDAAVRAGERIEAE